MTLKISVAAFLVFAVQYLFAQQTLVYSLDDCRNKALEHNKKMKIAQSGIDAAKASYQSVVASSKPALDASVIGLYLGKPLGGALDGMIPEYVGNGSITASVPIYAGGKIKNGRSAAGKGIEISEANKILTAAEVLLNVEKAYWQVVQVNEKIALATKFKTMLQSLEKDLKNSHNAGLIYKNDLLEVQVSLNEAEINLGNAEDGLIMAKLSLAQIIGNAGNTDFKVSDTVSGSFLELTRPEINLNAESRPEIAILKKSIEVQEFQKKILMGDRLPSFAIAASGFGTAGKRVNIKDGSNFMTSYYGLATISIPIFDWGKKSNKVREQSFKIAMQQQQLAEAKEFVDLEVQNAYLQLNQSSRKIKLSDLSLVQASENLRITEDRLKAGTIVGKDVLEAQAIWQKAYNSTIDARIEYKINEVVLRKALGELK